MAIKIKEKDIQIAIIHYLKTIGAYTGKTKTLGVMRHNRFCFDPYTLRGKCDLEAFHKGVMYGIEVKSEKGKLSPDQETYKQYFHKPPDRIYIEARSVDDVIKCINTNLKK